MNTLIQFLETHKAMDAALVAWFMREVPVVWGWLKQIFPYVKDNGGVKGVVLDFWRGQTKPKEKQ